MLPNFHFACTQLEFKQTSLDTPVSCKPQAYLRDVVGENTFFSIKQFCSKWACSLLGQSYTVLKVPYHAFLVITRPLVCYVLFMHVNGLQSHTPSKYTL